MPLSAVSPARQLLRHENTLVESAEGPPTDERHGHPADVRTALEAACVFQRGLGIEEDEQS